VTLWPKTHSQVVEHDNDAGQALQAFYPSNDTLCHGRTYENAVT